MVINYSCLVLMNVCFYIVYISKDMTHLVDMAGIGALVASLIYFAHTLPGSVLAWTEMEVPGEAQ